MSPEEYIQHLQNVRGEIISSQPVEGLKLAFDGFALVKRRIQSTGTDFEGSPFPPYTESYAKYGRDRQGYQSDTVDFTRRGRLLNNISPQIVTSADGITQITVKARDDFNQAKLNGQFPKRGNILQLSEQERALIFQAYQKRIDRLCKEIKSMICFMNQ